MLFPQAVQARAHGIHIIVVCVGITKPNLEVQGIASDPDSANIVNVTSYHALPTIINTLVSRTCECKPFVM